MKKKFLFLYIQAGGGHISTARAIAKYMDTHHTDEIDPVLIDGFTQAPRRLKKIIIDGYKKSQTTGQRVYEFLYWVNKRRFVAKVCQVILSRLLQRYIKKLILAERPTHMVILHFFLVRPTVHMIKKLKLDIKVTTIITDPFTIHKLRSLDKKMDYVVFSDRARDAILNRGVPAGQIKEYPVILKEEFSHPLSADKIIELKKKFEISLHKKVLLILWWGDGMPKGDKILEEVIANKLDVQVLIVCGRSTSFYHQVQAIQKKHPDFPITAFHGFIDFIYDVINVSDIIITKGWPATIMEILLMGKVPVVNSYIREQEKGNVEFIVRNKLGFYEPNVKKMVAIVKDMLAGWDITEYQNNIKNLHLRNGTEDVAEYLIAK